MNIYCYVLYNTYPKNPSDNETHKAFRILKCFSWLNHTTTAKQKPMLLTTRQ